MKLNALFSLLIITMMSFQLQAQDKPMMISGSITSDTIMVDTMSDDMKSCCQDNKNTFRKNLISVSGRYYFDALSSSRKLLSNNGFSINQAAYEYQVRLYNLPKVFFYDQRGSLSNGKYASVKGIGVKENLRWNILHNTIFTVAPYLELGAGYYRMSTYSNITSTSASTALNGQVQRNFVDNIALTGDLGLDLGVGINIENTRLNIIFSGGYIASVPSEWKIDGALAFGDKFEMGSPYAGVTLKLDLNKGGHCGSGMCGGGKCGGMMSEGGSCCKDKMDASCCSGKSKQCGFGLGCCK